MISTFLSSLFGKIAVGAVAVAVAATVTATGNLPDPAQQRVSDALSRVGIEVPAPDQVPDATAADAAANHRPNVSGEPTAPVLPAQASDKAKAVTATVFGSTLMGRAFGDAVSATAKGSASRDATRAVPAIPAVPAVPGKPTVPAIPATPAVPPTSR